MSVLAITQSGEVSENLENVTEGNHQVPGEIIRELRDLEKSGQNVDEIENILREFGGKKGNPNVHQVFKDFHQKWLHGDGRDFRLS